MMTIMTNNLEIEENIINPCKTCPAFAACFNKFKQNKFDSIWSFIVICNCPILQRSFALADQAEVNELRDLFDLEPV